MTAERKASELLREPNTSRAMVRSMAKLGRVQDDCGLLDEPDGLPEQRPTPKQSAAVIRLPLWPEPARGAPNDVLRSALFAAIQGKGREFIKHYLIAAYDGNQIEYTGEQLEQSDLDVWEQVLHLARQHPLGTVCQFKGGAFLKAIGRSTGKKDYQWLGFVLTRLSACEVRIKRRGFVHGRGLIASYDIDEHTGLYRVSVDPDTAKLYAVGWTAIDWQQRQQLRRRPLALWLHGYYSSHAKPLPVKVDTLRSLSGTKNPQLFAFRRQLRKALAELKAMGAIASWQIDAADLVTVDRGNAITASQRRHLTCARRPCRKRKN
jgi:TrfA protein